MRLTLMFFAVGCQPSTDPVATPPSYVSESYAGDEHWLCHPELAGDACDGDLDLTVVEADGTTSIVAAPAAVDPTFDCFYVYPTNSLDLAPNADWIAGVEEPWIANLQAARYREVCRVFAPLYRQVTITGLFAGDGDAELAYADVLDAFRHVLDNGVADRPFLLIGHSQGARNLAQLLAEHIEPRPDLLARLVSAHLIGGFVEVPTGEDEGGTFASTPLCRSTDQAGCVVHYNAYRSDDPPDADSYFGVASAPELRIACTAPGALSGGETPLGAVLPTAVPSELIALLGPQVGPFADPTVSVETPFYALPDLLTGACDEVEARSFLSVSVNADPTDPRADDIGGDLLPGWGLHLVDVNVALLDLVALAGRQGAALSR